MTTPSDQVILLDQYKAKVCWNCGNRNVLLCTDRVDDPDGPKDILVERCTYCGKDS